jgi:ADP-ribosyl-[dinitrogen reductase] hydrolase
MASRCEGALIGLAIGDALGTLVATSNFDAATLAAGVRDTGVLTTGASTATTRAAAESLLALSGHDPSDQMQRYLQWSRTPGVTVPAELKRAIATWQWSRKPNAGSHDPKNLEPHSLPRSLAVALFMRADAARAIDLAAEVSRTTQQSPLVLDLCRLWAALLVDALSGIDKAQLLAFDGPAVRLLRQRALKMPLLDLIEGRNGAAEPQSANDAMSVTRVAIAGFARTATLRDALIHVETSSRAAPAAAALCGALAGAHYGIETIPPEWRRQLAEDAGLRCLVRHLLG